MNPSVRDLNSKTGGPFEKCLLNFEKISDNH